MSDLAKIYFSRVRLLGGLVFSIVVVSLLAGCDAPITTPASPEMPTTTLLVTAERTFTPSYNERMARIADELPGYGGHFREDGRLVVLMKDQSIDHTYIRAAIGRFRAQNFSGDLEAIERRMGDLQDLVVRPAQYDFRSLVSWYGAMRDALWELGAIRWVDVDERTNRIEIGVADESLSESIARIQGESAVPLQAVTVVHDPGEIELTANLRGSVNPMVGGVQIEVDGSPGPCSLGYFTDRPADANWYFVTASHCTSNFMQLDGDTVGQPTLGGTMIGYEVSDPSGFDNAADSDCPSGRTCRRSDVALFRATTWSFYQGHVAWPAIGDTLFSVSKPIYAAYDSESGDDVHLVGKVSGRQTGEVISTCLDLNPYIETDLALICVWEAEYQPVSGDSGGPVVWVDPLDESFRVASGVNFARRQTNGNGFFSTSSLWRYEIQQDYGSTYCLDVWCAPDPIVSIVSGPTVVPDTSVWCEWEASVSRGVGPYTFTWSGVANGSGSSIFGPISGEGVLQVEVEDGIGNTDVDWIYVSIDPWASPPECSE